MKGRRGSVGGVLVVLAASSALAFPAFVGAVGNGRNCRTNQSCPFQGVSYRVTSVRLTRSLESQRTTGRFVVVGLTLTNTTPRNTRVLVLQLRLQVRRACCYDAMFGVAKPSMEVTLPPRRPTNATVVYNLPAYDVHGAALRITDLAMKDFATIRLGI